MMDCKKIIIGILTLVLITPLGFGGLSDFDPSVSSWYAVAPWEIEFCKKWGGSEEAGINQGAASNEPIALSQLTIALQGEKIEYIIANNVLYSASWYIEPVSEELEYKVLLIGDENVEIGSGIAKNTEPGIGYYANYINKTFINVRIEYPGNYIEVPIVP